MENSLYIRFRPEVFISSPLNIWVSFGHQISEEQNQACLLLVESLYQNPFNGFEEAYASFSSVSVRFSQLGSAAWVAEYLVELLKRIDFARSIKSTKITCIEVVYGGAELEEVALQLNLSTDEVIALHGSKEYRVFALGFLPGFAYLGVLDNKLQLARKARPTPVLKGSVAIAGLQTSVYTQDSPAGWWVIGHTDFAFFDQKNTLEIGQRVRFVDKKKTHENLACLSDDFNL